MGGPPSFDSVAKRYRDKQAAAKERAINNMKDALAELRKESVKKIIVEYDGHNDEGWVTRVVAVSKDRTEKEFGEDDLFHQVFMQESPRGGPYHTSPSTPLGFAVEFVMQLLESEAGGWENNQGGFGTCVIDVDTGEYDLSHVWGYGKAR